MLLSLDHAWPGPSGPPRGFAAVPAAELGVPEQSLPSSPRSYRPRLLSAASNPQQLRFNRERKKKRTELYSSFLGRHSWRKAMPNQLGRGAEGWHLPGTACQPVTGSSVYSWSCSGMGLEPPGKALAAARGAGASIPISRRASPLPGAACESRPPLLAPQPGRERAVSDVHEEKN